MNSKLSSSTKPYGWLSHPHKNWADVLFDVVFWLVAGFPKLIAKPPDTKESLETIQVFRERFEQSLVFVKQALQKKWLRVMQKISVSDGSSNVVAICEYVYHIERGGGGGGGTFPNSIVPGEMDLLTRWGVITKDNKLLQEMQQVEHQEDQGRPCDRLSSTSTLALHFFFPTSIVSHSQPLFSEDTNAIGCVSLLDKANFETCIPPGVPIVLWLHGGGQVLGMARDDFGAMRIAELVESLADHDRDSSRSFAGVIWASLEYRLAPEFQFPSGAVDAMMAIECLSERFPRNPLHVAASSGGAYPIALATVNAMKRDSSAHPVRIQSCTLFHPMLNPAMDTMGYHLNSKSSYCCPVEFIEWCWQAVLGINAADENKKDNENVDNDKHVQHNSVPQNAAWFRSKWYKDEEWRRWMLSPLMDPIGSGTRTPQTNASKESPKHTTKYLVYASRADPMFDDAAKFVEMLQKRNSMVENHDDSDVKLFMCNGNHGVSVAAHPKETALFVKEWAEMIVDCD